MIFLNEIKDQPLISVIVPVYNVEKYIRKCVDSIINQTYRNLEIILVDDGSPDGCGKICDEYAIKDNRIRVIHKDNGGLSDARNAGLEIALGEFIAFVDSDDWIAEDMYACMYQFMKQFDAEIAICGIYNVAYHRTSQSSICGSVLVMDTCECMKAYYTTRLIHCVAWNKLFAKKLWKENRFTKNILCEDEYIMYKILAESERIVHIGKAKYFYRLRNDSIIRSNFNTKYLISNVSIDAQYEFIKEHYPVLTDILWDSRIQRRIEMINKIICSASIKKYNDILQEIYHFLICHEPHDTELKKKVKSITYHKKTYIILMRARYMLRRFGVGLLGKLIYKQRKKKD